MNRPSMHIYFTDKTYERLRKYARDRFGPHRALSIIVERAVGEYLDREEGKPNETKYKGK